MIQKILFICPLFPPIGGIGVNRSLNLVIRLKDKGYTPIVATLSKSDITNFAMSTDLELERTVEHIDIRRINSNYPFRLVRFLQRLRIFRFVRFLLFPLFWEQHIFWSRNAYNELLKIIDEEKISLIYTTSAPFSTLLLGRKLKVATGLPWVADLRDPYTDAYAHSFPSKLHWKLSQIVEKKILKQPDILVVTNKALKELYLRKEIRQEDNIAVVYNGF